MNTENNKLKFIIPAILLILPVVLERQTKMKKSILLAMFISAFLICMCLSACFHSGIQQEAMESGWYQMQLSEVRKDNSKQPPSNDPDGKEIWLIEVDAVESHQILARWRKCLYSKNKGFLGYCIRGENRFFLKTDFLKTRLKKDDVILFTVKHRTVRSWLEGTVTIHQIDGNAMAKLNPDTGEFVPLEYDNAACLAEEKAEKTFETLRIAEQRGLKSLENALKQGLDPNIIHGGTSFFIYRLGLSSSPEEIKLLLKYGARPGLAVGRITPLSAAANNYEYPLTFCRLLLEAGADPNQDPGYGHFTRPPACPPLMTAVSRNHLLLAELLLEHGADPMFKMPPPPYAFDIGSVKSFQQRLLYYRPVDAVRDYRMAELLKKYIKDRAVKSLELTRVLENRITAPVPKTADVTD